jgi:predicted TIM-barrel fold metal-dependent hydrolase
VKVIHKCTSVRHALKACRRNRFPVVVHTGMMVWGQGGIFEKDSAGQSEYPVGLRPL